MASDGRFCQTVRCRSHVICDAQWEIEAGRILQRKAPWSTNLLVAMRNRSAIHRSCYQTLQSVYRSIKCTTRRYSQTVSRVYKLTKRFVAVNSPSARVYRHSCQSIPGNYSPTRRSSQCSIRLRESQCTHVPGTTVPSLLLCTTTGTISRDATRYNSRYNIWKSSTSVHQSVKMARYSSRLPRFAKDALASHTRNTAIEKGD